MKGLDAHWQTYAGQQAVSISSPFPTQSAYLFFFAMQVSQPSWTQHQEVSSGPTAEGHSWVPWCTEAPIRAAAAWDAGIMRSDSWDLLAMGSHVRRGASRLSRHLGTQTAGHRAGSLSGSGRELRNYGVISCSHGSRRGAGCQSFSGCKRFRGPAGAVQACLLAFHIAEPWAPSFSHLCRTPRP